MWEETQFGKSLAHRSWGVGSGLPFPITVGSGLTLGSIPGWPKGAFGFFHKMFQKNPKELFHQPSTCYGGKESACP